MADQKAGPRVDLARFARQAAMSLVPYYRAPEEPLLRMDQNTNILGVNPALETLGEFPKDRVNQYPTRDADALLAALAADFRRRGFALGPGNFVAGNGGDEVLDLVFKAFVDTGDRVALFDPSYSYYPHFTTLYDARVASVPLDASFRFRARDVPAAKLVVVASPNNPTGNLMPRAEIVALVERGDCVVLVDEAYVEFAGEEHSLVPLVADHPNLVVLRTFSKVFALAGARVGYAVAAPETSGLLRRVKPPFNVNVLSEWLAVRSLEQPGFRDFTLQTVRQEKPRLAQGLEARGFRVFPSDANFLLAEPPAPWTGPRLRDALRTQGIAARTFEQMPRIAAAIRFTVGTAEQNARLFGALDAILGGEA